MTSRRIVRSRLLPRVLFAAATLTAGVGVGAPGRARADALSEKLSIYETEARALATDLPQPGRINNAPARLVDAEVAYSLGDYAGAALMLFDLVDSQQGVDKETALYYLGEALYQKGDHGSANGFLSKLPTGSKYYQLAQLRIVEIAIADHDTALGETALRALDGVGASQVPAVPYVRGKFLFSQGKYDDALAAFAQVAKGSDHELAALYYTGTTQIAKKDLSKASDVFADLVDRKPKTTGDRRIIELGQLALGRLNYEREQPTKAIDAYLLVDRHSDLFPTALYEVAWVYVKNKQYDKALRSLELLQQSDPLSADGATVQILEGNLRIRKAQMIRQAQIAGTASGDAGDPETEYEKAIQIFTATHDQNFPSYEALARLVDGTLDATPYVEQIAGRASHAYAAQIPIPETASEMMRQQPAVASLVEIETDLEDTRSSIAQAELAIMQIEGVLAAGDRTTLYPALASRRDRIAQMQDDLIGIRNTLADQQLRLVDTSGELAGLTGRRKDLAQQYAALGDYQKKFSERIGDMRAAYDKLDDDTGEITSALDSSAAMAVALRTYSGTAKPPMAADQKSSLLKALDGASAEAQAIDDELAELRRDMLLGRDLAPVGDEGMAQARVLRDQLRAAQDAEHRVLAGMAGASRDRGTSQGLVALADRAARLAQSLSATDNTIDATVVRAIEDVKRQLVDEKKLVAQYKQELADYEAEAKSAGGVQLTTAFKDVKAKFDDLIVRTDVGAVDAHWAQKEDADDDLKRLNLARSRELKQLKDEFKDILDAGTQAPAKKPASLLPPPTAEGASPDATNGKAPERVAPTGGTTGPATPTVKPSDGKSGKQGKGGTP